nr:acyltransferase family protein [uncultured Cohaesibacter sp.]
MAVRSSLVFWGSIVAFVISLGFGHWGALNKPDAAFFLLPTRAWELLVGVFVAFYLRYLITFHDRMDRKIHQVLASLGLVMVLYSIFAFNKGTAFPGLPALVPTVGAGLIIMFASQGTWVNGLLSTKGFVGIGLISYSAYLWHNPLMVFARHRSLTEPNQWLMGLLCFVTFVMAFISWRYVERPFRNKLATSRRLVFSGGAVIAASMIFLGLYGNFTKGMPKRFSDPSWTIAAEEESRSFQAHPCLARKGELPDNSACVTGDPNSQATIVLWGDSHATHILPAFKKLARMGKFASVIMTKAGCKPIPGVNMLPPSEMRSGCPTFNQAALEKINSLPNVRAVFIAGRWQTGLSGSEVYSIDNQFVSLSDSLELMSKRLNEVYDTFEKRHIQVIFGGIAPIGDGKTYDCAVKASFFNAKSNHCNEGTIKIYEFYQNKLVNLLPSKSEIIDYSLFLSEEYYPHYGGDEYFLLDNTHFSKRTALRVFPILASLIGEEFID